MSMCLGSLGAEAVPPIGANNYSSLLLLAFSHRMLDQMAKKFERRCHLVQEQSLQPRHT
jgi:hypothetical protein